jgi:isocitrate dehydrogenase
MLLRIIRKPAISVRKFSSVQKIKVRNPLVCLNGDEMANVMWDEVKTNVSAIMLLSSCDSWCYRMWISN